MLYIESSKTVLGAVIDRKLITEDDYIFIHQNGGVEKIKIECVYSNDGKSHNEFGANIQLDVLNAQVDFNNDSLQLVNFDFEYQNQKLQLIELIIETWRRSNFEVLPTTENYTRFEINDLLEATLSNNSNLLINENSLMQSQLNIQIAQSEFEPKITAQAGYNFNLTNPVFYNPSANSGQLTTSVSLSIPLFDGRQRRIREENAKVEMATQQYFRQQTKLQLERQVRTLYQTYQNQLFNIDIENSNLEVAERNLTYSRELLKYGQITNPQFRKAQLNLLQAQSNIATAKFTAKQLEFQLFQLAGRLI